MSLNCAVNLFLVAMVLVAPPVLKYGYDKQVKIEEARRGQ